LAVVIGANLLGCDPDAVESDFGEVDDAEASVEFRGADIDAICDPQPDPPPTFHDPPYDCSESQDVGYDAGAAFDITVVNVDGKPVEKDTANAFWVMRQAAAADGVDIHINSGFRTMADQEYFWMCYQCCCCNSCNLAAQPGYSNHQSGHALDLNASAPGVHAWLVSRGAEFGFSATVPSENWHWEWWGGGPGGGICDIASSPGGNVDNATCETISGWAQDPDDPEAPLDVLVVFDGAPGEPQALEFAVRADQPRPDLCDALGSCDHAFTVDVPLGLRDGMPHSVRVFASDTDGGDDTEFEVSPPQVHCAPPELEGVRRRLPDAATFDTWGFSDLFDVASVEPVALEGLDEGSELGVSPFLVTDSPVSQTWLVDKGYRRAIESGEAAEAWHFDLTTAQTLPDDQLDDIPLGTPLRPTPLLATVDGLEFWLIDDPQAGLPGGGSAGGSASGGGDGADGGGDASGTGDDGDGPDGLDDEGDGACACRSGDGPGRWSGLIGLLVVVSRRRRSNGSHVGARASTRRRSASRHLR
jgi:hypothetical protein